MTRRTGVKDSVAEGAGEMPNDHGDLGLEGTGNIGWFKTFNSYALVFSNDAHTEEDRGFIHHGVRP